MSNIYVIKHYWDESDYGTKTVSPWSEKSGLSEIKNIKLKLTDLTKYSYLSKYKPNYEKIDGYYIYYCYKTKDDPDPTNQRKVTDITFFISKKKIKNPCSLKIPESYIIKRFNFFKISIFILPIIAIISFLMFKNFSSQDNINENEKKNKKIILEDRNNSVKENNITIKTRESYVDSFCEKYIKTYRSEFNDNLPFKQFLDDVCTKKVNNNYRVWLEKKDFNFEKNIFIKADDDEDINYIQNSKIRKEIKKIIEKGLENVQ